MAPSPLASFVADVEHLLDDPNTIGVRLRALLSQGDWLPAARRKPLALKLYAWGRTHRPNDRGQIFYSVTMLAQRLGCSDQNSTRRRKKLIDAVEAVCAAAPDEFTGYQVRQGRTDQVLTLSKKLRRPSALPAKAASSGDGVLRSAEGV
jgi:hypothetical protein